MSAILSIQSHVAYGHVGNSAAVFALQRVGREVWPIHTVQFSNHTGYGGWRGRVFEPTEIDDCVAGLAERGVLKDCAGVLSGYMGSAGIGAAILRAVERVRGDNREAAYCCDPVLGDVDRGFYVRKGVAEFMRDHATQSLRAWFSFRRRLEQRRGAPPSFGRPPCARPSRDSCDLG
jgi:pyridoxine kinase